MATKNYDNDNEEITNVIKKIIIKDGLNTNSNILYGVGSEIGDGYMSNTLTVDIIDGERSLNLFLKCPLDIKSEQINVSSVYGNEKYFYDFMYPAYLKFARARNVADSFENAPKCYATTDNNMLALENLKAKNYRLFSARKPMNESHIEITFKALAKFHAISFAIKDQEKELYEQICSNVENVFKVKENIFEHLQKQHLSVFLSQLDSLEDKDILDRCGNLISDVLDYFKELPTLKSDYETIIDGDCWCNNTMYQYENEDTENPINLMLLDWQVLQPNSVVKDLSHFFYTTAAGKELKNLKHFQRIYYSELSDQIKKLGSDPDILYPYLAFEEEWKQYSLYGYGIAVAFLNTMISPKEEKSHLEEQTEKENKDLIDLFAKNKYQPEYFVRLKDLTRHLMENGFVRDV